MLSVTYALRQNRKQFRVPDALYSPSGEIERSFDTLHRPVPDVVEVRGKSRLLWMVRGRRVNGPFYHTRNAESENGMLQAFLNLRDAPVTDIAKFMQRWGLLGITKKKRFEHGEQPWHLEFFHLQRSEEWSDELIVRSGIERADHWRYWSGRFRAAVRFWAGLEHAAPSNEWDAIFLDFIRDTQWCQHFRPLDREYSPDHLSQLGWAFVDEIGEWMTLAGIALKVEYGSGKDLFFDRSNLEPPQMRFHVKVQNAFASLVLQLIASLSGVEGFVVCSQCGRFYEIKATRRRPRAGRKHYCGEKCRRRARANDVRRFRQRNRDL